MSASKLRLGIIGCGGIARSRHVTGLTLLKRDIDEHWEQQPIPRLVRGR